MLASNLSTAGLPLDHLFYTRYTNRPGSGQTTHQYQDRVLRETDLVLCVGSPEFASLTPDYSGLNMFSQILLNHRRSSQKWITIPLWFEGSMEENFPTQLHYIPGRKLTSPIDFFDLLVDIHCLCPVENIIIPCKEQFYRIYHPKSNRVDNVEDREIIERMLGKN